MKRNKSNLKAFNTCKCYTKWYNNHSHNDSSFSQN